MDQQQMDCAPDGNQRTYTLLSNVPQDLNEGFSHEQQIVYYKPPVNYQTVNNPQAYMYPQQIPNNQIVNQFPSVNMGAQLHHHQQQHFVSSSINTSNEIFQPSALHSNMNQQQMVSSSSHQPPGQSIPIATTTERGRSDTSGISQSNVQQQPQYSQPTRIFNSGNTPNNRISGVNQQRNEARERVVPNDNEQVPSVAACRFATTRFPFSPFTVIFSQEVREKIVVDDLIKHAFENSNFELKTVAYRKGRSESNEHRILIFVENTESFVFLYNHTNWPGTLADRQFTIKSPSIPPQLSLVMPYVSLQIDWEEFVQELKNKYPDVANVIRLKNKAQQPIRSVKLELLSCKLREEILAEGVIPILHMKMKVVEYYSQANVLICSNCFGIGHFRKSCTQKNESTCKTCGEKCANLNDHQCSGVLKCIHCGGDHVSNDPKCKVVKDYRAALTRNLLANIASKNVEDEGSRSAPGNTYFGNASDTQQTYATVTQGMPSNSTSNEVLIKKMEAILVKMEEESTATRQLLENIKEEMRFRYKETKQQVDRLEIKVKNMEKKFEDFSMQIFTTMQNMCTALRDPQGAKSTKWKSYWQEEIRRLSDYRSSFSISTG